MKDTMHMTNPVDHARDALSAFKLRRNIWLFPLDQNHGADLHDAAQAAGTCRENYYNHAFKHKTEAGKRRLSGRCLRHARNLYRWLRAHRVIGQPGYTIGKIAEWTEAELI